MTKMMEVFKDIRLIRQVFFKIFFCILYNMQVFVNNVLLSLAKLSTDFNAD